MYYSDEKKIEEIHYWMQFLLDQMYSTDAFDREDFERTLQNICGMIDLKFPKDLELRIMKKEEPKLTRHPIKKTFDVDSWKEWNSQYLKQLA